MRIVWLLTACCFAFGCSQQFILGVPEQIAASAGVGLTEVGQLMTVFGLSSAVGTPLMLVATASRSQRDQMVLGLVLMAAGMLAMGATSFYPLLLAARVVMGLGNGMFVANAMAIATTFAKPGHEASAMANVTLGFSLAQVLAMPLARSTASFLDWHAFYGVLGAFALVAAIVIGLKVPGGAPASPGVGLRERLAPLADRRVAAGLAVVMLTALGYATFYTYVTPFLEGVFGSEGQAVSTVLLASGLMTIVGSKGSGFAADRFGVKTAAIVALCLQIATLAALGLLSPFPAAVAVFMCLWAAADWSFMPAQNLLFTKLVPGSASMAIALSSSALQLGNAAGAALGGVAILAVPLTALPLIASGIVVVGLVVEALMLRTLPGGGRRRTRG